MERNAAKGLYFPTISLNAGYVHFNNDLKMDVDLGPLKTSLTPLGQISPAIGSALQGFPSSMSQTLQKEDLFVFGASALWPIYSGGKISAVNKAASIKTDIAKAMLAFGIPFLIKEIPARKKRAMSDGLKCIESATSIGLVQTGGSPEFPIFSQK